jgi:hypothetical protein
MGDVTVALQPAKDFRSFGIEVLFPTAIMLVYSFLLDLFQGNKWPTALADGVAVGVISFFVVFLPYFIFRKRKG